ncbi:homocysteine S-methyltransferase family protein [Albimonas pacifica]|uniref:Homocysteine S-methyltransferase n=1 Tax=Albimonas pacifica TaxID=1114924 RepID=A0A1I3HW33_9RHOB|nr:homocysteine S-methyltransferase family protein [Albimonas pacifica]SFI39968.1 homocysteine S-methyltransferase [Albimonas pacifica]
MFDRSSRLPQLTGAPFLTDAGVETDLIFNRGVPIRALAAHTLLPDPEGRAALADYFRGFLALARETGSGFILDAPTWKAHPCWSAELGEDASALRRANHEAVAFVAALRDEFAGRESFPILLNAPVGPRAGARGRPGEMTASEARDYHSVQLEWLAETDVDMVTATTHVSSQEATGFSRAASDAWLRHVISFTVESDGRLPSGETLAEAIRKVDVATNKAPAYFMVNCAHPDHFAGRLEDADWARRIRGVRCDASRRRRAGGEGCDHAGDDDPEAFARLAAELKARMPWMNVFGGCCGSDLRHVTELARALRVPA